MKVSATIDITFNVNGDVGTAADEIEKAINELGNTLDSSQLRDGEYEITRIEQVKE